MALNEEEVPVNNIGSGAINGAGTGSLGEPGVKRKPGLLKRYKGFKEFTNGKRSGHKS